MKERQQEVAYLRSGPAPAATVSLTVRTATLYIASGDSSAIGSGNVLSFVGEVGPDDSELLQIAALLKSEIMMAETDIPAESTPPAAGNSKKAFADFILRSRLLI